MSAIDVLAAIEAEVASLNRVRRDLGEAIAEFEDKGEYTHRAPDDLTLADLNHTVIRLRAVRAAVAELIEAVAEVYGAPENAGNGDCSADCMSCRIVAALARVQGGDA